MKEYEHTHTLCNNLIAVNVKNFGAELCSVKSHNTNIEYIWQANPSVWARYAPNLFPIVGKLKNGEYSYNNKTYKLPQHGFARDSEFTCIKKTASQLVFELKENSETLVCYPFQFTLYITYTLIDNKLTTNYTIYNKSSDTIFFSVGAHPAFNCPLQATELFEDYELQFKNNTQLIINTLSDGLISDTTKTISLHRNTLPIDKHLFDNDALVCMNTQIEEVSLISKITKHGVTLVSKNWPCFGIWTKKQTNQFICLEPWYGIADNKNSNGELTKKAGIIMLSANQLFKCEFECLFF